MVTEARFASPAKAYSPMVVSEDDRMVTEVKPGQPTNEYGAMKETEEGMVTDRRLLHPAKAFIPMEATEDPMDIESSQEHPSKA